MVKERVPVLIVGAGPVGLSLAGDLGWRGIHCLLVERSDGSIYQPKMDMVGIRTMEFCRRWGIAEDVIHSPYPRDYPQDNVWVESLTGWEFGRERMVCKAEEPIPPQSPTKRERCPQDMFDPILTRFVRQFPEVSVEYDTELVGFVDHGDRVTATLRNPNEASEYEVDCDYLVGTDGAASTVRRSLGIPMQGTPVLTYTTNVIFRCKDMPALHDKGKAYRFIFIDRNGTWLTIVAIDGKDRWRMSVVGNEEMKVIPEKDIHALIVRAMGKPFRYEIESVMPWVRRQLLADTYQKGRVFLAGDSCHLTSPTGGFGMNTGIADSVDLGWKLEAVLKGWGGSALLESYTMERRPVADRALKEASENLRRMLSTRTEGPPDIAFQPGPEGEAARKQYGDWYTATMKQEWYSIGIHLGFTYDHSGIVVPDGTETPPDLVSDYIQTSRPGHRAPHVWLSDGRSTLDLFGRGLVLLDFVGRGDGQPLEAVAAGRAVPLTVVDLSHEPEAKQTFERALVLVRPDGHVAWRGDALPEDLGALVDTVRGFVPAKAGSVDIKVTV